MMMESIPQASDADLAEQAAPANGLGDQLRAEDFSVNVEADVADLVEQHQDVPQPDDDYAR